MPRAATACAQMATKTSHCHHEHSHGHVVSVRNLFGTCLTIASLRLQPSARTERRGAVARTTTPARTLWMFTLARPLVPHPPAAQSTLSMTTAASRIAFASPPAQMWTARLSLRRITTTAVRARTHLGEQGVLAYYCSARALCVHSCSVALCGALRAPAALCALSPPRIRRSVSCVSTYDHVMHACTRATLLQVHLGTASEAMSKPLGLSSWPR